MKTRSQTKIEQQQQQIQNDEPDSTPNSAAPTPDSALTIPPEFTDIISSILPIDGVNFEIDFDEASRAWRSNKIRVGESYKYVCQKSNTSGSTCKNKCLQGSDYCKVHTKMIRKHAMFDVDKL